MKTFLYLFFLLTILSFVTTSCVKETKRPDSIDAGSIESATEFEVPAVLFLKTGGVLISNAQSKLYALNAVSGAVIWEKAFDDYNSTRFQMPCIKNNTLYYITQHPGVVYAVNARNGDIRWSSNIYGTQSPIPSRATAPVIEDSVLFFCATGTNSESTSLYAYNIHTGTRLWEKIISYYDYEETINITTGNPSVYNGVVYTYSQDSDPYLYALNAHDGSIMWKFSPTYRTWNHYSNPCIFRDIVFTHYNGKMYALDAATGIVKWSADGVSEGGTASPVIYNNTVIISGGFKTVAYDINTGALVWTYTSNASNPTEPAIANDLVYVGYDQQLFALGAAQGKLKGSTQPFPEKTLSTPIAIGVSLYQSTTTYYSPSEYSGTLYALNRLTGEIQWQFSLPTRFANVLGIDREGNSIYPAESGMKN